MCLFGFVDVGRWACSWGLCSRPQRDGRDWWLGSLPGRGGMVGTVAAWTWVGLAVRAVHTVWAIHAVCTVYTVGAIRTSS